MKILVFLFVISNLNLVFAEEKDAKKTEIAYKFHLEPQELPQNDQIAESSNFVKNYGVMKNNQYRSQNQILSGSLEKLNGGEVRYTYNEQNLQQHVPKQKIPLQENLSHDTVDLNNVGILQPSLLQQLPQHGAQQIYLQQYPPHTIRILGTQASPFHQIRGNKLKTLGYSSYIEHLTEKDDEEIKSALKEGSVGDIKRLIPKSGISFQIYQTDKNVNMNDDNQKTETHVHSKTPKGHSPSFYQQYRIKPEIPVTQFRIQTAHEEHQQSTAELGVQQETNLKNEIEDQQNEYKTSQDLLQPVNAIPHSRDHQDVIGQTHDYIQPFNLHSQKTLLETNDKSIYSFKPLFKINVEDNNYNKAITAREYSSLSANKGPQHILSDVNNLQHQKQWSSDTVFEGSQKTIKNAKHPPTLQFSKNLLAQVGGSDVQSNTNKHEISKSVAETSNNNANVNYLSDSDFEKASQNAFAEHLAKKAYLDKETTHNLVNLLSDNYVKPENVKTEQNYIVSNLETTAYSDSQATKDNYREGFSTKVYSDSETAKSSQHNLISHVAKSSFAESKNGQNNFDHQKALEGSTSFDIKNAIDNTGTLMHQTNSMSSTAEVHPLEDIQKQQLAYVAPKIPVPTVLIDSSIHDYPKLEGHPLIKDFGQAVLTSAHLSHQTISSPEVRTKFFNQPQTTIWTSDHLKQGHGLTANDFHPPLIKLHLPKEEIYKLVETPKVELPTSSVSHISYPQQKQPYIPHYDVPLVKHPHEIHFYPKTKTRIQNSQVNHIKLAQPITIDWGLFKSTLSNYNTLALKPELLTQVQEIGKKIVPVLVRKRKNRSNKKQEIGIVYGKVNNRRPGNPNYRQEKNVRINLLPEVSTKNQFEGNGKKKNEFSVSASYKVDRSLKSSSIS